MLVKLTNLFSNIAKGIALVLLVAMMLLTVADVFGRYVLDNPVGGTFEITEISMVLIVMLGLSYTQLMKSHVSIGLIADRLSKSVQKWIDLIVSIIAFGVAVIIIWQGIISTHNIYNVKEVTDYFQIPAFYIRLFIPLGFLFLAMQFFLDIIGAIITLRRNTQ